MNHASPLATGTRRPNAIRLAVLLWALALPWAAQAQLGTPAVTPSASAPRSTPPLRPVPNLSSPADAQRSMDLDNEQAGGKVVPQVRIPLGKNAGPAVPVFERRRRALPVAASAPAAAIDDAVARCESEPDKQARAACKSRIGKP